jgi:branched-chain amino acid transport system substrate-binding protein
MKNAKNKNGLNRREFIKTMGVAAGATTLGSLALPSFLYANAEPIKLGFSISLTGRLSGPGKTVSRGYEYAVDWINKNLGGVEVAGKRRKVELIVYDDESDAKRAAQLVEKVIVDDKVDLVLGPVTSGITYPTLSVIRRYDQVMIEGYGTAKKIYEEFGGKEVFITIIASSHVNQSFFQMVKNLEPKPKTVAMFTDKGPWPQSVRDFTVERDIPEAGLKLVVDETVPMGIKDLTPVISKAKSKGADIFCMNTHHETGMLAVNQIYELNYNPKMVYHPYGGFTTKEFFDEVKWRCKYHYTPGPWNTGYKFTDPFFGSNQVFVKDFEKKYGHLPSRNEAIGAGCVIAALYAIKTAGTTEVSKVRSALKEMNVETVNGQMKFDSKGRALKQGGVLQRQGDEGEKFSTVYPAKLATDKIVYPQPTWKERGKQ